MRRLLSITMVSMLSLLPTAQWASAQATAPLNDLAKATLSPRAAAPQPLVPGTRASAFLVIKGNVLTLTDGPLGDAVVRLRDATTGHIVDKQITDATGLFVFQPTDPGAYVVELVAPNLEVIATSPLVVGAAGEELVVILKLRWVVGATAWWKLGQQGVSVLGITTGTGLPAILTTGMVLGTAVAGTGVGGVLIGGPAGNAITTRTTTNP